MERRRGKKLVEVLTFLMRNDGDDLDWVARQAAERGLAPPEILKDKPELLPTLQFYWQAFNELLSDVTYQSIPWSSIDSYARRYNVQFETFRYIIRAMEKARREDIK